MAKRTDDSDFISAYAIKDHKFMTMEAEKRERVITAALKEFTNGYTAANTDVIVKEAGISKGLLFHYFGSKRGLFLFLIKYYLEIFMAEFDRIISEDCDFLENLKRVSNLKLDLAIRYPLIFSFQVKAFASVKDVFPEGLPEDLLKLSNQALQQIWQKSNRDQNLFKEGVDQEKAQNIMIWTINGLTDSLFRYGDDIDAYLAHRDELVKEIEAYQQLLRKILYR